VNFVAVTSWPGTPQEVVTLYFYANETDAQRAYANMASDLTQIVRRCVVLEESDNKRV
jgi:hypothetical protein